MSTVDLFSATVQVVVVSRRTYQLARSEEPRRFIDELPYFPQLAKQTVAESFIAKSLGMNNFLVKRGQAADFVYLVKSGQLTIQLQVIGTKPGYKRIHFADCCR